MARKPTQTENIPSIGPEIPAEYSDAANVMAVVEMAYSEDRDLLNQLLGQAQMADAFGKFSQTVWSSKLAYVKENKLYRALAGMKMPNGLVLTGTWSEFCNQLGVSDEKANQDIANLNAFGEEALESMSRMGIGYREMRQFRRLPEDQKTALIEVARLGDKESFIELAEEIIAKHTKEKEALTKRAESAEEEAAAKDRLIASKNERLDTLETELGKKLANPPEPDELLVELHADLSRQTLQSVAHLDAGIRSVFTRLADHHAAYGGDSGAIMAGALDQIERITRMLREDFALSDMDDVQDFLASLQATPGAAPLTEGL